MMGEGGKDAGQPIHLFKIVLVGEENAGKTWFLRRYFMDENYKPTVGVDFITKQFETGHGDMIKLQAWDTAGQERFRTITNAYYRRARGIILMYDVTNRHTFDQLSYWMEEIKKNTTDDTLVVLVASKADAEEADRQVCSEEGKKFADERNIMFFEARGKEDKDATKFFQELSEQLLLRHNKKASSTPGTVASTTGGPVKEKPKTEAENVKLGAENPGELEKEKKCHLL